jgi:hypothetical protein
MEEKNLERTMLPFKLQQLITMIIQRKGFSLEDALQYLYSSELYKNLSTESSSLWFLSTLNLYEMLKKEKLSKRTMENSNSSILLFQVFCLENYKNDLKLSAEEALHLFMECRVFEYLQDVFEELHTQSKDYIITDIKKYIQRKK